MPVGLCFGFAAYQRLRRSLRLRRTQSHRAGEDALVARCLASYEDGFEDVTARVLVAPDVPVSVERVLEQRTLNIHRVIVFLQTANEVLEMARLKRELAAWVRRHLRGSWFRGLGLGIVLRSKSLAELEDVYQVVDGCGDPTVILQWFIFVDEIQRRGLAVHMPVPGKTTPCFVAMLSCLAEDGYSLKMAIREKTGAFRTVSAINEAIPPWLHGIAAWLH